MYSENKDHASNDAVMHKKQKEAFENATSPPYPIKDDTAESTLDHAKHDGAEKANEPEQPAEEEWVAGFKLVIMLISITLACFLMMLDTSVIATVSIMF